MKFRIEFNDGKKFSHYAIIVFKLGFQITYLCSGILIFSILYMNIFNYIQEIGPEVWQELSEFYFPSEIADCMNCDEID